MPEQNRKKNSGSKPAILYSLTKHILQVHVLVIPDTTQNHPWNIRQKPRPPLQHRPSPLVVANDLHRNQWLLATGSCLLEKPTPLEPENPPPPWIFCRFQQFIFWGAGITVTHPYTYLKGCPKSWKFVLGKKWQKKQRSLAKVPELLVIQKFSTSKIKGLGSSVTT